MCCCSPDLWGGEGWSPGDCAWAAIQAICPATPLPSPARWLLNLLLEDHLGGWLGSEGHSHGASLRRMPAFLLSVETVSPLRLWACSGVQMSRAVWEPMLGLECS